MMTSPWSSPTGPGQVNLLLLLFVDHCCWLTGSVQVNLLHLPYVYHDRGDSSSDIASVHFTKVFFVYSQLIAVDLLSLFVWV